jgi:glycerol-3-phosphate cytidylyltransferase-like family protein/2-polyprenyl-3-methyl-5-hydroxy-6-metoxy-1,4-benzoquinol methylase
MVDGGFDPIHAGHIAYLREAKALGAPLLCNLSADECIARKHPVVLPQVSRAVVVGALDSIHYVHPSATTTAEVLDQARPKYYVKGKDWEGRLPDIELQVCKRHGIEIVYLDTILDSSTSIVRRLLDTGSLSEQVDQYEDFILKQATRGAEHYSDDYFHSSWRDQANDYRLETRRRLEGRNPELIKDVFQAKSVVDMGCGPGALMYLLWELGVNVWGVDFAEASVRLAPAEVRDRIRIGSVTDVDLPDNAHELVICREVFEHLTVLQAQKAVQNLCRITSRYVYLTTRFHPAPKTLFDVTTEFEVDPTHITLQNMDMLRLMFVLQGTKRRNDLEARMDWLNKGRVLVYEKVATA